MIGGHGNNIYQYDKGKIVADFSSNIAFNNNSDQIIEHLKDCISSIKNYPDPYYSSLSLKLADFNRVSSENILVVNGSAEAFYMVAHLLKREVKECRSLILTPSFAEYEDSCALYDHDLEFEAIDKFDTIDFSLYNSVWFGTPNNPDGFRITNSDISNMATQYRDTVFVVDKAYNELSGSVEGLESFPENVIVINSLTKSFGIPGLRLGYLIASNEIIQKLTNLRPPWSVNSISLAAGEYIFDNYDKLLLSRDLLIKESLFLQEEIAKLPNFEVARSSCNFFLVKILDGRSVKELSEYLIDSFGILIRNCSNFRSLTPYHFRIAAQSHDKNMKLIEALRLWR